MPICLAGTDTDEFLTAEPALVVDTENDQPLEQAGEHSAATLPQTSESPAHERLTPLNGRKKTQHGVTLRRAVHKLSAIRQRTPSVDFDILEQLKLSGVSPFERSRSFRDIGRSSLLEKSASEKSWKSGRSSTVMPLSGHDTGRSSLMEKSASEMSWKSGRTSIAMNDSEDLSEAKGATSSSTAKDE